MIHQVVIRDNINGMVCGGIQLNNGDVICGHCGSLIKNNRIGNNATFTILEGFEMWIDLSPLICEASSHYN